MLLQLVQVREGRGGVPGALLPAGRLLLGEEATYLTTTYTYMDCIHRIFCYTTYLKYFYIVPL